MWGDDFGYKDCSVSPDDVEDADVRGYEHTRPNWCPLMVLAENERLGIFRFIGKGKITPNTEMWIEDSEDK